VQGPERKPYCQREREREEERRGEERRGEERRGERKKVNIGNFNSIKLH
jgi:hypothetical protein